MRDDMLSATCKAYLIADSGIASGPGRGAVGLLFQAGHDNWHAVL